MWSNSLLLAYLGQLTWYVRYIGTNNSAKLP